MQKYIKISTFILMTFGFIICILKDNKYKFKVSDLILILPIIMIFLVGDGKLTTNLSSNRSNMIKNNNIVKVKKEKMVDDVNLNDYDFNNIYFDVIDDNYMELSSTITFIKDQDKVKDKTIKVRGFSNTELEFIKKGYFVIGKYGISCCAADASLVGFVVKIDDKNIKNNTWYELIGVLIRETDVDGYPIMAIKINDIEEINSDNESQYVYPCYAYDNGQCKEYMKYNLNN